MVLYMHTLHVSKHAEHSTNSLFSQSVNRESLISPFLSIELLLIFNTKIKSAFSGYESCKPKTLKL
jgi:hypothetical protein